MQRPDRPARSAALRVLLGFALYFVLGGLWLVLGLDRRYDDVVSWVGVIGVPWLTHFPIGASSVNPLAIHNQGFVIVLLLALALTVRGMGWSQRLSQYSLLGLAAFAVQVTYMALQLHLILALRFQEKTGTSLLLPWETEILRRVAQMCFIAGLAVVPFLALALTAWCSFLGAPGPTAIRPARRGAGESRVRPIAAAVLVSAIVIFGAWRMREVDPRHVTAHVVVGNLLLGTGNLAEAERQYAAALRWGRAPGGPTDPARDRALLRVGDPTWRTRLGRALGRGGSKTAE